MRTVERTPQHQRFLMVGRRVSETAWRTETQAVRQWLDSSECDLPDEQREKMLTFIDLPLPLTSVPLVVLHAYADVGSQTIWNLAFDPRRPQDVEPTVAILRFCVLWHRAVTDSLSHGHHQIAVVDFPDGVPSLVSSLHEDRQRPDVCYIGLCDAADHESIALHNAEFG